MQRVLLVAATVAAVLAAIVGANLLGVGRPNPTTGPTPIATSLAPALASLPPNGAIAPGRYFWTVGGARVTVAVPAGWIADDLALRKSQAQEISLGPVIEAFQVYADACTDTTVNAMGQTAADLVTALERQLSVDTVTTTLDLAGVPATRIDIAAEAGLDRAACSEGLDGPIKVWRYSGAGYFALAPDVTGTVLTLDVRGARLVFTAERSSSTLAADAAELDAMIASLVIGP
jgi:hypothetical protein